MNLYQLSFPNNKKYIGITTNSVISRFNQHKMVSNNSLVNRAIKKYSEENVKITILAECDDWELLCLAEIEAIEKFNTMTPNGYNLTIGGEGTYGYKHTDMAKIKISNSAKGRIMGEEGRRKISVAHKNKIISEEHKIKIGCASRGRKKTQEELKKISMAAKGRVVSLSTRFKLSQANTGKKHSEETKKKLSELNKGNKLSIEHINKLILANTGRKSSDETKEKLSKSKLGHCVSDKTRLKISNSIINGRTMVNNNVVVLLPKGIYLKGSKYIAKIKVNGKSFHVGTFNNIDDAKNAREIALFKAKTCTPQNSTPTRQVFNCQ